MQYGYVKMWDASKGFGFIEVENSNEDIFVHESGLIDNISDNDKVQFSVEQGRKGMNAVNVEIIQ